MTEAAQKSVLEEPAITSSSGEHQGGDEDAMNTDELPLLGHAPESLETRRLRAEMALMLFGSEAPDVMKIGPFVLVRELGKGGQGVVYEAEDRRLDRRVAIKRLMVDTSDHRDRLRKEGRALARVDHPNVVRIYEVGEDETERTYLVMELVEGRPLHQWRLDSPRHWSEVVELMAAVGDGLAAIHDAGVIHRDIKPQNIIIKDDGVAKLIDLGIATLDGVRPVPSESNAVGTAGYIAPERYEGVHDARSDQYGFCVTLYEALFGRRPPLAMTKSEMPSASGREGRRRRVSGTEEMTPQGAALASVVGLDDAPNGLSAVLARGMQEEPAHRFEDMHALVAALRSVLPRPRRWPRVAAVAALVAGTAAAVAFAVSQYTRPPDPCDMSQPARAVWSDDARQQVREAFARAGGPSAGEAFAAVDAMLLDATEVLDERWAEACAGSRSATERSMALATLQSQHATLRSLSESLVEVDAAGLTEVPVRLAGAIGQLQVTGPRDACEQTEAVLQSSPELEKIEELRRRAFTEGVAGDYEVALGLATEALDATEARSLEPVRARLLLERGRLALEAVRLEDAIDDLRRAGSLAEQLGCDGVGARAHTLYAKAQLLRGHGDLVRADEASRLALEKLARVGSEGPDRASALKSRGLVRQREREYEAAIQDYREALEIWGSTEPPAPLDVTDAMLNLGVTLAHQGKLDEAVAILREAIAIREAALWPEHPSLYKLHASLSNRYLEQGDLAGAEAELSRALELATSGLGEDHPRVATLHIAMARVLDFQHDFEGALRHANLADEILVEVNGERELGRVDALEAIGQVQMDATDYEHAIPTLRLALEIQAESSESTAWDLVIGRAKLARAHARNGEVETALHLYDEAVRAFRADPSRRTDPFVPELLAGWGEALVSAGQLAEAVEPLTEVEAWWADSGTNPERLAHVRWQLAQAKCVTKAEAAESLARQALSYFDSSQVEGAGRMRVKISDWLERGCTEAP